jgi:L-lysine exporter family protein LysE/ArgO
MFLTGFALCLSASLDLGIVNVATIKLGLDRGSLAAFVLQVGSCCGDMTYALLSMFGLALVLADSRVRTVFWIGGTIVLLYLAGTMIWETWRGRTLKMENGASADAPLHRDFLRGLALALSSPSLIIWFATAGGAIIAGIYGKTHTALLVGRYRLGRRAVAHRRQGPPHDRAVGPARLLWGIGPAIRRPGRQGVPRRAGGSLAAL